MRVVNATPFRLPACGLWAVLMAGLFGPTPPAQAAGGADACLPAIVAAERAENLPEGLLRAIALVESGRTVNGRFVPWPWAINADGRTLYGESRDAAVAQVEILLEQGVRNIDLGCLQISRRHHPDAFPTLTDAFDPGRNATYAARFLRRLHQRYGSWPAAVAHYHSGDSKRGAAYREKVYAVLQGETGHTVARALEREAAQGPLLEARLALDQGALREAMLIYTDFLQDHPDDPVALAGRAAALRQLGLMHEAYYDLERLYLRDPGSPRAFALVSEFLDALPADQRRTRLVRLVRAVPEEARLAHRLVQADLELNDEAAALAHVPALARALPDNPMPLVLGALLAERLDRPEEALDWYQRILALPMDVALPDDLTRFDVADRATELLARLEKQDKADARPHDPAPEQARKRDDEDPEKVPAEARATPARQPPMSGVSPPDSLPPASP